MLISQTWTNAGEGITNCYTTWGSFNATQGQEIRGTVTVSVPDTLVVYILSTTQIQHWQTGNQCDPVDSGGAMWHLGSYNNYLTTAAIYWATPKNGTWWILTQTYSSAPVLVTVDLYSEKLQST